MSQDEFVTAMDSVAAAAKKNTDDLLTQIQSIKSAYLASKQQQTKHSMDPARLDALPWTQMKKNPKGHWVFLTDQDNDVLDYAKPIQPLLDELKEQKRVVVNGWSYNLSGDGKFLNRFPASTGTSQSA
jgi:hypothetical protein